MSDKERRKTIRIPLLAEACTWVSGEDCISSQMLDISDAGVFVKSEKMPETKEVEIRIALPGELGTIQLPGKVIRKQWAAVKKRKTEMGFAVQFEVVQPGIKKILDSYCIYLRNKQIIVVSKRIIEEFFAGKDKDLT